MFIVAKFFDFVNKYFVVFLQQINLSINSCMISDLYKPINLQNFEIIRSKIANIITSNVDISKPTFQYHKAKKFTDISELRNQLEELGLYNFLHNAVINVSLYGSSPIHIDTGDFTYSLNIPILGYRNSFLHFFESYETPTIQRVRSIHDITYQVYNRNVCNLIQTFKTITRAIVNTLVSHCFNNCNIELRVVLLLRIHQDWNSGAG